MTCYGATVAILALARCYYYNNYYYYYYHCHHPPYKNYYKKHMPSSCSHKVYAYKNHDNKAELTSPPFSQGACPPAVAYYLEYDS